MVPALPMMLAALLAQTGSSMSDETLADRLIAALPDSEAVYAVDRTADPVELAQLEYRLPPPMLGQHTREVLRDVLAVDDAELDRLASSGAI